MFETYTAAQYRGLSHEDFVARQQEVVDLMSAEELPEGVTDEMLYAEADLIKREADRRNRAVQLRNTQVQAVTSGAGRTVATNEPQQRGFQAVSEGNYLESEEYRRALAMHIARRQRMPEDILARARQQRSAGDPVAVSFLDGYSNVTDPTMATDMPIPIPLTIGELIETRRESGLLLPLVSQTSFKGGVVYPLRDLVVDFHWITDKQVSPYQYDNDKTTITFTWHEFEARFARTKLFDALISADFKNQLAGAIADGYGRMFDEAIMNGNGTTQPLGILNDTRVVGYGEEGQAGYIAPSALIVEATADDLGDWKFWTSILYKPGFDRLYRADGTWLIGDATYGTYLLTLKDEVNRPIVTFDLQNNQGIQRLRGNRLEVLPNNLLGDFDTAEVGDVVAIFGNMKNYALNFQPEMPLTTTSWEDYETNTNKTRVLGAVDGKVLDNHGFVIVKKAASA